MCKVCLALATVLVVALGSTLTATEVPGLITYQGRLTDDAGTPLTGNHNLIFSLYVESSGITSLWTETHLNVPVTDGLFEVLLGTMTSFPGNALTGPIRYLGIRVDGGAEGRPLTPVVSVPYAFHASTSVSAEGIADNTITSSKIVDHSVTGQDIAQNGATSGQVLKWDGSNWIPAEDLTGSPLWQRANSILQPASVSDTVDLGPYSHGVLGILENDGRLNIGTGGTALRIRRTYTAADGYSPALQVTSDSGWSIYSHVGDDSGTSWILGNAAVLGSAYGDEAVAGYFVGHSPISTALGCYNWSGGPAFRADVLGLDGPCALVRGGRGLRVESHSIRNAHFEAVYPESNQDAIVAVDYSGGSDQLADHFGVKSTCKVADYWGVGGRFEGGFIGGEGWVAPDGSQTYYGLTGRVMSDVSHGICTGVFGEAQSLGYNYGVYGAASSGERAYGVYGWAGGAATNYAGYFQGDVYTTGTYTSGGSLTRTDHPLDPDNMYLQTASVESPEMLNVYSGNAVTDPSGYAIVTLPDYVQASNTDFRYQLTVIGDFAQAIIAEKIANNQFTIRTDKPNIEISWQITGLRNDLYARAHPIEPELLKSAEDRGKYVHPELFGRDDNARIGPPLPDQSALAEKNRKIDEAARSTAIGKQPVDLPVRRSNQ